MARARELMGQFSRMIVTYTSHEIKEMGERLFPQPNDRRLKIPVIAPPTSPSTKNPLPRLSKSQYAHIPSPPPQARSLNAYHKTHTRTPPLYPPHTPLHEIQTPQQLYTSDIHVPPPSPNALTHFPSPASADGGGGAAGCGGGGGSGKISLRIPGKKLSTRFHVSDQIS